MDIERAEGIVLRCQPVTETSLIVTWFTREFGKLKTLAKGARRPKSPMRGKLDLFYRDELLFLRSRRSDLHLLHECFLEEPHAALRESVEHLTAASYVCELVDLAMELEDASPKVFDLLEQALDDVGKDAGATLLIWFELQLLAAAGWAPRWGEAEGISRILRSLAAASRAGARRVQLNEAQVMEARETLEQFWVEQVGKLPRSRTMATGKNIVDHK
jgi:DNA repair protein RecO (recombination protein O)